MSPRRRDQSRRDSTRDSELLNISNGGSRPSGTHDRLVAVSSRVLVRFSRRRSRVVRRGMVVRARRRGSVVSPWSRSRVVPTMPSTRDARGQSKLSEDRAECGEARKCRSKRHPAPCRALRPCLGLLRVRTELTRLVRKRGVLCRVHLEPGESAHARRRSWRQSWSDRVGLERRPPAPVPKNQGSSQAINGREQAQEAPLMPSLPGRPGSRSSPRASINPTA
jgi:hypothetical protein